MIGNAGNDWLFGEGANDFISGWDDDDHLFGGPGDDYLFGDQDNDELNGEEDNDILLGGIGLDDIDGGSDTESITFTVPSIDDYCDEKQDILDFQMAAMRFKEIHEGLKELQFMNRVFLTHETPEPSSCNGLSPGCSIRWKKLVSRWGRYCPNELQAGNQSTR